MAPGAGGPVIVTGYYPWWYFGGLGAYGGYYGLSSYYSGYGAYSAYSGYYDPWFGGYPDLPPPDYSSSGSGTDGTLRLKIKPNSAEVYVDGYYVGIVDDFDGIFQKLHIESGTHRIEVRAPGYEPLTFDVRISPDHGTTYSGELRRIQ
jgi:hypothetical protein